MGVKHHPLAGVLGEELLDGDLELGQKSAELLGLGVQRVLQGSLHGLGGDGGRGRVGGLEGLGQHVGVVQADAGGDLGWDGLGAVSGGRVGGELAGRHVFFLHGKGTTGQTRAINTHMQRGSNYSPCNS